ncbi:MAG: ANTAR domain-containing protein [Gaiellaceae bacterium]
MNGGSAAPNSSASESIRLGLGDLAVVLPPETSPAAVAAVEKLLDVIDQLAERTAQLHVALDSRIVIEQAKGILAERMQTTPEQAFHLLRATARRRRLSLHRLAETIVSGREARVAQVR